VTQLTEHFSLAELTHSQTASRLGLDNTPDAVITQHLVRLAQGLEQVRALVRCPIVISSGYRSPLVNKAVGGAAKSQHVDGHAADITAPTFGSPRKLMAAIVAARLPYDQCILEYANKGGGWVHISFTPTPRGQALVIDDTGTRPYAA
jgi:zinc D-Ala-D-Ala carboxypeptidase